MRCCPYRTAQTDVEYLCNQFKPKADYVEVKHGKWVKDKNKRTCSICGFLYLENGKTYRLTLNGIDGAKDFSTPFTINDTGISSVTGLKMYRGNAELGYDTIVLKDVISAGCVVDNPTSVEKKCILLLVEYDAEQKLMRNIKYHDITASPYSSVTIDTTNNTDTAIAACGNDSVFKAFVLSSFESLRPLTHFVQK